MVAAAKLWNMVRYVHPRLTGDSTAWDNALLAAIPSIEAAHSDEELAVALDTMLATLHDPCTRIALGIPGKGISVQALESDTMVIHAGNGDLNASMGAGLMLKMGIPQTSNLVWDLRGSRMPIRLSSRADIGQLTLSGIGYAYREHSGYPAQEGIGSRHYSSAVRVVEPQRPAVKPPETARKQVYLIDKDSAVPVQAIIEQINGRTAIISEDPPHDLQAGFTELVNVLGKVVAEVRVAELRYPDGTTEFAPSRVVLNRGEEAVKAAAGAMTGGWGMPGERQKYQAGSSAFRDMPYGDNAFPNRELRILAAMRTWGVLHYFDPYVSALGDKWDDTLVELLPKFSDAKNAREYHLAVAELVARSGDTGASARSPETVALFGPATAPFEVRFIEDKPVITRILRKSGALAGDVIEKIDGGPVPNRMEELSRLIAAPSPAVLRSRIGRLLLAGAALRNVKLTVRGKDDASRELEVTLSDQSQRGIPASGVGEAIRLINERIGYADLERVGLSELDGMFDKFRAASAIIFDLRGYPRDTALAIAARLGDRNQLVAAELFRNVVGLGSNDSHIGFLQSELRVPRVAKPRYAGKTVALIDEQSAGLTAESAMCLKAVGNTILIGGAAFPVFATHATQLDVPGGIKVVFSGEIPRWPGGKLVYPEGVRADVEVRPTIAGIRAGRDEVLDAAVEYLSR
jgi:hypothetical protein